VPAAGWKLSAPAAPDRKLIVSRTAARHRKPPRSSATPPLTAAPYRTPAPDRRAAAPCPTAAAPYPTPAAPYRTPAPDRTPSDQRAPRNRLIRAAAAFAAGSALLAAAWFAAAHWRELASYPTAVNQADELGAPAAGALPNLVGQRAAALAGLFAQQPKIMGIAVAKRPDRTVAPSGYLNPLRAVTGLVPERIDEGVDFGGSGPVYALGNAVITNAGQNAGWPGGGWITYRLTDGPAAGLMVYLAEDVTPTVQAGQHVTTSTVIANMFDGGDGIEIGWAQSTGVSAESELPEAGGIGGAGPFPTMVGLNFDRLLQLLGVPAAPNAADPAYGILPASYPGRWN
jgi:murein DD-endopeptidase MepM/ murein hydrolase activator NlpD